VDRAVGIGLLTRAWSLLSGPVTLLVIASRLSPAEQGYYYTFASLLVLQTFLELGLGTVIVQFASHEWSGLGRDERGAITGDAHHLGRLGALARFSTRWYAIAAPVSAVALGVAGHIFFSRPTTGPAVAWQGPWLALCVLSSANLLLLPVWSVLEGCNQIVGVYLFRFLEGVATTIATWTALSAGARLWAPAITAGASLLTGIVCLLCFHPFVRSLLRARASASLGWREEILPLQWRIAVTWLSGYFIYQIFTPASFRLFGPAVAGRVGVTAGLASMVAATAYTWMAAKAPTLGVLVAKRDRSALDRLFRRTALISGLAAVAGGAAVWGGTFVLYSIHHRLATRLLPPMPTALFLIGSVISAATWNMAAYARAHKAEPFIWATVVTAAIAPPTIWLLGKTFGLVGFATTFPAVLACQFLLCVRILRDRRREWTSHAATAEVVGRAQPPVRRPELAPPSGAGGDTATVSVSS
jgi:hypothetical protein